MADLIDICEGIAANIRDGLGDRIRVVSPLPLVKPEPVSAHVLPGEVDYHQTFGDLEDSMDDWTFTVEAFLAQVAGRESQKLAAKYLSKSGDSSIIAAIESDTTLGGLISDLIVTRGGFRYWDKPGTPPVVYVGGFWTVQVLT